MKYACGDCIMLAGLLLQLPAWLKPVRQRLRRFWNDLRAAH